MVWVAEGWGKERRRKPRDKRHMAAMVVPLSHWSVGLHGSHHPFNCRERKKVFVFYAAIQETQQKPRHSPSPFTCLLVVSVIHR